MGTYSTIPVFCFKLASATLLCLLSPILAPETLGVAPAVAQTTPDQGTQAEQLFDRARLEFVKGQLPQAKESYQQVLTIYQELGNSTGVAQALNGLGQVYNLLSQETKALEVLQEALKIRQGLGERKEEGETLTHIGTVYSSQENYAKALELLEQALTINQEVGNQLGIGYALVSLGSVYSSQGEYEKAFDRLEQGLSIIKEVGETSKSVRILPRYYQAAALNVIGLAYIWSGKLNQAWEFVEQAHTLSREEGYGLEEGVALTLKGILYNNQGELDKGLETLELGLAITKPTGFRGLEQDILFLIGGIYNQKGEYLKAIDYYQQSLAIRKELGKRKLEGIALNTIGVVYHKQQQYDQAINYYQQALAIHREVNNQVDESTTLGNIAELYRQQEQYDQAIDYYKKAFAIHREVKNHVEEWKTLFNIGQVYYQQEKYQQGIDYYQKALAINQYYQAKKEEESQQLLPDILILDIRDILGSKIPSEGRSIIQGIMFNNVEGSSNPNYNNSETEGRSISQGRSINNNRESEGRSIIEGRSINNIGGSSNPNHTSREGININNIGVIDNSKGEYVQTKEDFQVFLAISQDIGVRSAEGTIINNIGEVYSSQGEYDRAKEYHQQSLAISQEIGVRSQENTTLNNIGFIYYARGEYAQALEYFHQALVIQQDLGARFEEATTLGNIGTVYISWGDYAKALNYHQQSLKIKQDIGDKRGIGATLNNIGRIYTDQGEYERGLKYLQQALAIQQEIGDRPTEAAALIKIGTVYSHWGKYPKALEYHQKALAIRQEIGDQAGIGTTYNSIGGNYLDLGDYAQGLDYFNQANAIFNKIGAKEGIAETLSNIGTVYQKQKQYPKSLQFYQQSLAISQQIGNRLDEAKTLTTIGTVYEKLGDYTKANDYHQQALEINQKIGVKAGISSTLYHMGIVYTNLEKYPQALAAYQQALALSRTLGTRATEGKILAGIGKLYDSQNQSELAITFFKQSVNVREGIRKELKVLPIEQQQSFTDTVAQDYRRLADLLTQQNRNLEALRVLDLLKVQELQDYLSNVRGDDNTVDGIRELTEEQEIIKGTQPIIDQAIALGQELSELETIVRDKRTQTQQQRIIQLRKNQAQLTKDFQNFLKSPEVEARLAKLRETTEAENLDLKKYAKRLQEQLQQLEQDAVILYPLVLDDRLELVLVTPYAPPIRRTVKVKQKDLERAIKNFRRLLANPARNARPPAEQLYEWLIKPIEADLAKANAKTIIYAPDGKLRYIPLGALYDGEQWLIERLRVNQITALSLTSLDNKPTPQLDVFAAAVTKEHTIPVGGDESRYFGPLPFTKVEVERLAQTFPNTKLFIDKQFHGDTIYQMNDYSVVHLATHAEFKKRKQDSIILFGDGSHVTLSEVEEKWDLSNVDLVVLSACQTGLGGELGDGKEILGFGYLMQNAGADAAIASLWTVDDQGTQALMNKFYQVLKQEKVTKAEALRQAQIAFISSKVGYGFEHPYFWAPFILIGNGL